MNSTIEIEMEADMARANQALTTTNPAQTAGSKDIAEQIRRRAYELYLKRGQAHGNDWADWLQAEREVKQKNGYKF